MWWKLWSLGPHSVLTMLTCACVCGAVWELYTGEDAFQRLQHPGQFFETVVLQDLRPVIPQGVWCLPACLPDGCRQGRRLAGGDCGSCIQVRVWAAAALQRARNQSDNGRPTNGAISCCHTLTTNCRNAG